MELLSVLSRLFDRWVANSEEGKGVTGKKHPTPDSDSILNKPLTILPVTVPN